MSGPAEGWPAEPGGQTGQGFPWPAGPPPYVPGPPASERVLVAWQERGHSDYLFNFWTALGWTILTLGIYAFYVFYQLVRRSRDHNARRLELLDAALTFGWEEAGRQGLQEELTPSFQRASAHLGGLQAITRQFRDPVIWVLLSIVASGVVHIVAFVLLDQDLVNHDRAEVGVEYELAVIYGRLGCPLPFPDVNRVKGRQNYAGRIIAAVFSFGIYLLWWYYDMMVEPNRHFYTNWAQEDALAGAVQTLQARS